MNLGVARIVIIVAFVVTGVAVLANGFGSGTSALTRPGGTSPEPSGSTSPSTTPSHSPKATPAPEKTGVLVSVFNGNGAAGCAKKVSSMLVGDGYQAADTPADASPGTYPKSTVYYRPDPQHQNQSDATYTATKYFNGGKVAKLTPTFPGVVSNTAQLAVLIGNDYRTSC